jgi:hypothetical protein
MANSKKQADGCLFVGSTLCDSVEFANLEFGTVRFTARVVSRSKFRIAGAEDVVLTLRRQLTVGEFAPLQVADEHLGIACLEELFMSISRENGSHMIMTFMNSEAISL